MLSRSAPPSQVPRVLAPKFLLNRNNPALWLSLLSLALLSPALFSGFMADDYLHFALFHGLDRLPLTDDWSLFGMYSFIDGNAERLAKLVEQGFMPWWTYEDFKYSFFRPIAEISHWLDYQLWPESPLMMHAHNLVWYFAVLLILGKVYGHLFDQKWVWLVAFAIFALDSSHAVTVSWIANRNALIAATFALLSLLYFLRWVDSEGAESSNIILSVLFLFLGLLSAEIALSITPYFFAYAVFIDKRGPIRGLLAILPLAIASGVWLVVYKIGGYGASGVPSYYVDPLVNTAEFLERLQVRLPALLMSQWGLVPAEVTNFAGDTGRIAALIAQAGLFVLLVIFSPLVIRDKYLKFWLVGTVLSALPVCSAWPQDRNLMFIGIGGAAFIARFVQLVIEDNFSSLFVRVIRKSTLWVLVVTHLFLSPLLLPFMSYAPKLYGAPERNAALVDTANLNLEGKSLVFLRAPLTIPSYFNAIRYYGDLSMADQVWPLTTTNSDVTISIKDSHSIELHLHEGMLVADDQLVRDPSVSPIKKDEVFELQGMKIQVTGLNEQSLPERLIVTFEKRLDSPDLLFFTVDTGRLVEIDFKEIDKPITLMDMTGSAEVETKH